MDTSKFGYRRVNRVVSCYEVVIAAVARSTIPPIEIYVHASPSPGSVRFVIAISAG
jgi:hypothetical protein